MTKILVIGGAGYIGSKFCEYALSKNSIVHCYDNFLYNNNLSIKNLKKNKKFQLINKDLRKFCLIENYDIVIIFAGLVGDPITKKYKELSNSINYFGIKSIINFFSKKKIKLIFISTCSNYGFLKNKTANEKTKLKPISLYAKQKVKIEQYILSLKNSSLFEPIILRFATAFGVSKRMRFDLTINEFVLNAFLKKNIKVYDHLTWRPYCHVDDFCKTIFKIIKCKKRIAFQIYNVGSNKNNLRKIDIAKKIKKILPRFNYQIINNSNDPRNYIVNFSKINKIINTKNFKSIDHGINEIVNFLKSKKGSKNKFLAYGNFKIKEK